MLGLIQSFLQVSMFHDVVSKSPLIPEHLQNLLGYVFLTTSDQFIMTSFGMILLIPSAYPVYRREIGSRLYSPTAYFIAQTLSNTTIYVFYPLLVTLLTYFFAGFPLTAVGFFQWLAIMTTMALCGICFGQVIGCFVTGEYSAIAWLLQCVSIYYSGGGVLVNAGTGSNTFGDIL